MERQQHVKKEAKTMKKLSRQDFKEESGSLVVAMIIVMIILVMLSTVVATITSAQDFTNKTNTVTSATQEANAAISDAAFQLDQYNGTDMTNLPSSFCFSTLTPVPSGCQQDTYAQSISNFGQNGWTYHAQLVTPPPSPSVVLYKVTAIGYFNGYTQTATVYFSRLVAHDGLTGLWGLNANGYLGILPSTSTGTCADNDNDASSDPPPCGNGTGDGDADDDSSAGVNQGAVGCGGLITGQGYVNIYGRSTSGTSNCSGQPTGSSPLDPQNPSPTCPPPAQTTPPTPCVPSNTGNNYYVNPTPTSPWGSNCPSNGVFSGTISPDVYICDGPITLQSLTIAPCPAPPATCPNNGVAQIFVFIPQSMAGGTDVTFAQKAQINAGGASTNLQINVSEPYLCGPPSNGTLPAPGSPGGGGTIYFKGNGSNIPGPIDAELYAPNDQVNVNGAPFTNWVGNLLVCYMNINGGGGGKATLYDNITYDTIYSPWYTYGYTD
jgi:hypothetical protein